MKTPFHEIEHATQYDPSVVYLPKLHNALARKYITPQSYSQKALYGNMFQNKTAVYENYPMNPSRVFGESTRDYLIRVLKEGLPKNEKILIRTGEAHTLKRVTIHDAIDRWIRGRSKFGVTDLHFRGTKFYDKVDAHAISHFNLLPHSPEEVSFLEMLTLVISSRGIFSDSHSDDGDGSNHCFVGKKLWLAWDRLEGQQKGLQDCTHDTVYDKAKFNMEKFISLKSAHWFTVSDNQTLFMPGNFTHKVITLDPYIGFGSFYVSLPGYLNTLKRWILHRTGDVKGDFLAIMNKYNKQKIKKIAVAPDNIQKQWGYDYLKMAKQNWKKGLTAAQVKTLEANPVFSDFMNFLEEKGNHS